MVYWRSELDVLDVCKVAITSKNSNTYEKERINQASGRDNPR